MFWMRLLLYLDSIRFFGAMLVVLKVMMKESLIFFALLIVIIVGFLQAFIGMDNADSHADVRFALTQASPKLMYPGDRLYPPSYGQRGYAVARLQRI
jgi:hypothetical protein